MFDQFDPSMYGLSPGMAGMFMGMPQYRQPSADVYSQLGIMSPQQQMFQGISMQNMLEQQQLARQQQMMALQSMSMNMGANAAQVGSGFAGPMMLQMGGLRPAGMGAITNALNAGINAYANRGNPQSGMTPMGPQAQMSQGINPNDPQSVIAAGYRANNGDPAKALRWAADYFNNSKDPSQQMMAGRLYEQAEQLREKEAANAASVAKDLGSAHESEARTTTLNAGLTRPVPMGQGHDANGNVGLVQAVYNPATKTWSNTSGFWGPSLAYAIPNSPGGADKNLDTFQGLADTASKTYTRIGQLEGLVKNGAPIGWAQDGASWFNDVLGTLKQIAPGDNVPTDVKDYMSKTFDQTFQSWATKGEIGESTAQDLVMTIASGYAGGRQVSKNDVQRAEAVVGAATSNPSTLISTLENFKQRQSQDLDRAYGFYKARGVGMGPMAGRYGASLDAVYGTYKKQVTEQAPSGPIDMGNGWTVVQH
jgi:hypothetical protein